PLIQTMDRHHREQLLHRPVVRHRLKDREVSVVGVGKTLLEVFEVLRHVGELANDPQDLLAAVPEHAFDAGARAQVEVAQREQRRRLLLELQRVVIGLLHVLPRDARPDLGEVTQHLRLVLMHGLGWPARHHLVHPEHVEDQDRVMRHHGTPGLGHDVGMLHLAGVAGFLDEGHHVVRILLDGVVHRRVEVGLRAVVVDSESAAYVHHAWPRAELVQLYVDATRFAQRILVRADGGDLRADVKVQEFEAIQHVFAAKPLDSLHDFNGREPELRAVPGGLDPLPGPLRGEPRAHSNARANAELTARLDQEVDLAKAVDHDDRVAAEALGQERRLDVRAVLVPVANDERAGRLEQSEGDEQLGLASGLEPDPMRSAFLDDLFDDLALLVHFDRIHTSVAAAVPVLVDRALECAARAFHAARQDVGEANEERRAQAAALEVAYQLEQIDPAAPVSARADLDASRIVDREKTRAPALHEVEL